MKKNKDMKENSKEKRLIGFRVVEDECIWMKAGVINLRFCDNAYDCYTCRFDKAMQRAMRLYGRIEGGIQEPGWVEIIKACYQDSEKPCRYSLTGRIDAPKICPLNYECYHCTFDQMMDDFDLSQLGDPPNYYLASGYKMADGYYYHLGHCWVRFDHGGRVRIGFDDFVIKLLGAFELLSLPTLGENLNKDQAGWTIGRNGRKASLLSPVTGTVIAANRKALDRPEILHKDPYNEGWVCIIEPDMPKENLDGLYFGKDSMLWMEQESRKLLSLMGPGYERLAATGAQPIDDIFGHFPKIPWDVLVKTFLRKGS
ncbi:MAG: glycine cleavage system protein H [Desulfobacterales bacterium]|jgi:glycine cleavage system H lipoate-binding protein|nr:glycine cleavage system protein H [Desulfobacterales bacterium]